MNDLNSLLLATSVLALGGVGMYLYTSQDQVKQKKGGRKSENEDDSWFGSSNDDNENEDNQDKDREQDQDQDPYDEDIFESKKKAKNVRTKRTRGKSSGTKRRY
jgi:hypothetical protein